MASADPHLAGLICLWSVPAAAISEAGAGLGAEGPASAPSGLIPLGTGFARLEEGVRQSLPNSRNESQCLNL